MADRCSPYLCDICGYSTAVNAVGGITANLLGSQSNPNAWIEHLAPSQTLYSWPMNNHWHTNYKADQEGPTVFRYVILPHTGLYQRLSRSRVITKQRRNLSTQSHPRRTSQGRTVHQ